MHPPLLSGPVFFFNDTAPTEIYPLSLHDALPISPLCRKNALVWNDLSSHCGTAPAGRAAVGGSCDGGSLWYSRIAREGAGMVWIRRELPRTIRREFGLGLIA